MVRSFGLRSSALGFLAVVAALAVIWILGDSPGEAAGKRAKVDQSRLLLRLPDLPAGYVSGYEGGEAALCKAFVRSQDELPPLEALVRSYSPKGCLAAYERLYTPPGEEVRAPLVFSGVMALKSAAAADATWALLPRLLGTLTENERVPSRAPAPLKVGTATRFFKTSSVPDYYPDAGRKASFLAWRSGNVVAIVAAISTTFAESDATVAELAPRQQAHIRKPTPYTGAERFGGEVGLDDPAIDVPIYWLGRHFRPGGGLPKSSLFASRFSEALPEREESDERATYTLGPSAPLQIYYGGITLATWTSSSWPIFTGSEGARVITSWKCTQTRTVPIAGGSATIYGGYKKDYARCPKGPPRLFTAWVDVAGVKVVVNPPYFPYYYLHLGGPYNSFKGMRAIVSALVERPKPLY